MDQQAKKTPLGRRDFLKSASLGAAVGAAALVAGQAQAAEEAPPETTGEGAYQLTEHIKKYYETASG